MENQPTIQERLNSIVYLEIKELKDVLDKWFSAHEGKNVLKFSDNPEKMPIIHIGSNDDDGYLNHVVKRIENGIGGYNIITNRYTCAYNDDICEDEEYILNLDINRDAFIPGELSKLTEFVKKWANPAEFLYHFSDKQKEAIEQFKAAMKAISKQNVALLVDVENKQFVFANCNGLGEAFFNGSDGYMQTGYCTHVADIDTDRLPRTEDQYDTDFMDGDGIELVKEK